jgi:hypothetical protein
MARGSMDTKRPNMTTPQKKTVPELLNGLGQTKSQVAKKLRDNKIKGIRGNVLSCPIALYLQKKGFKDASVGLSSTWLDQSYDSTKVPLPKPVQDFITAFDRDGMYKALEKKAAQ